MEQVEREHGSAGSFRIGVTLPNSHPSELMNGIPVWLRVLGTGFQVADRRDHNVCRQADHRIGHVAEDQ